MAFFQSLEQTFLYFDTTGLLEFFLQEPVKEGGQASCITQLAGVGVSCKLFFAAAVHRQPDTQPDPQIHKATQKSAGDEGIEGHHEIEDETTDTGDQKAHKPSHENEKLKHDPEETKEDVDENVATGDNQDQICVMVGNVADLMAHNSLDLFVGVVQQALGAANGMPAQSKGVGLIIVLEIELDLFGELRVLLPGLGNNFIQNRLQSSGDIFRRLFTAGLQPADPFTEWRKDNGDRDKIQDCTNQESFRDIATCAYQSVGTGNQSDIQSNPDKGCNVMLLSSIFQEIE